MTNETTASQPKNTPQESIGDDSLWARTEDIRLRFANPTSIPRSTLLHYAECLLAHLAILRAPAAQASATIQAGQWVRCTPDLINAGVSCGETPRRPNGVTHSHDHFIAHSAIIQAAPKGYAIVPIKPTERMICAAIEAYQGRFEESYAAAVLAATIQGPVMVAEPYAEGEAFYRKGGEPVCPYPQDSDQCFQWMRGYVTASQAAPMVADPAGVDGAARLVAYIEQLDVRLVAAGFDHPQRMKIVGLLLDRDAALAATVKAVPSEAVDACTACDGEGGTILDLCYKCKGSGKIATPLANKTGGDE